MDKSCRTCKYLEKQADFIVCKWCNRNPTYQKHKDLWVLSNE